MNCIAVDDEKLVLELIVDNIRQVPYLNLIAACKNAIEATAILQKEKIDIIFLDIQMPKLSGLQFIQTMEHPPMIILITAYEQYALDGYRFNVVDYLLKPVSFDRFLKACNKAKELFDLKQDKPFAKTDEADHIFVYVEYVLVKVLFDEILFVEGLKDYLKIHLASSTKPVLTKLTMKTIEEKLPAEKFIRIHKSYIASVGKIKAIKRDLLIVGSHEIPISNFYKQNLEKVINK